MVTRGTKTIYDAVQSRRGPEKTAGPEGPFGFLHKEGQMKLEKLEKLEDLMTLWIWSSWMTRYSWSA